MKSALLIMITSFFCLSTLHAAQVLGGRYDASKDQVQLDVRYGGGCGEHTFTVVYDEVCLETFPMQTGATLIHTTDDNCEAIQEKTIAFDLNELVCRPASVNFRGASESNATVFIPEAVVATPKYPLDVEVKLEQKQANVAKKSLVIRFSTKEEKSAMCYLATHALALTFPNAAGLEGRGTIKIEAASDPQGICLAAMGPHRGAVTLALGNQLPGLARGAYDLTINNVDYGTLVIGDDSVVIEE